MYSRMVIAVPVLLGGQWLMESRFRMILRHIDEAGLLGTEDRNRMDGMISLLKRLRDSIFPEVAILVLLMVHTLTSFKSQVDATPWLTVSRTCSRSEEGGSGILIQVLFVGSRFQNTGNGSADELPSCGHLLDCHQQVLRCVRF